MIYIEAPNNIKTKNLDRTSIFLVGGITGCPDWQTQVREELQSLPIMLFNPRRENFPIDDPDAAEEQIRWEYRYLCLANGVLFWFPCETLCPITLYELGTLSAGPKCIFVGVHPDYARRQDIEIQTQIRRPDVRIVYSLEGLLDQVRARVDTIDRARAF